MSEEEKKEEEVIVETDDNEKTFTLEEVEKREKELSWNHEKWVQKLINWQKAYKTAMSELSGISDNPENLVKLFSNNEKAAKIILDTYYEWQSIEDFKKSIEYKVDYNDPKVIEDMVEKKVAKRESGKLIKDSKDKFVKELELSWKELKDFEAEFEDRQGLKSFNPKTIQKHLEAAYRDSNGNTEQMKKVKADKAIADAMWTAWWKWAWKATSKTSAEKNSEYNKSFLKTRWIL